jgi:Ras family protein T1
VDDFWLPRISGIDNRIPIIIAGNKKDLVTEKVNLKEFIDTLVREYPQIDIGVNMSTKHHKDMADLLYCIQRAVLYPIYPLFNQVTKELRPKYVSALERIFRLCDTNHDNYLDNEELKDMQEIAFSGTLTNDDICSIKELLVDEVHFFLNKSSASIIEKKKRRGD